jgi:L-ascorbate metabolism protein UlaG (beta-lactamase superfamily)
MRKVKIISFMLGVLAIVILILLQTKVLSFDFIHGNNVLSKNIQSTVTKEVTDEKNEIQFKMPENFTEGIYIKKYPDNFACFKFETPNGIKVIVDPYYMNETVEPNIVTESHQHWDHTDLSMLKGAYKLITTTGEFSENGIEITGFPGKHDKGDNEGTNFIYVFNINGIRIAHFASQGEVPSDEVMKSIGNVDILLIQTMTSSNSALNFEMGLTSSSSKLNLEECKSIIEKLNPKIVIPNHGTRKVGQSLATYLNTTIEYGSTGEILVTKNQLNKIKGVKVIDLDTPK